MLWCSRGEQVRVLDDFSTGKREDIEPFAQRIDLFEGDAGRIGLGEIVQESGP